MRTTLTLDDQLIEHLMQVTGENNHTAAIKRALQDYLQYIRKQKLLALRGAVDVENNWRELRQKMLCQFKLMNIYIN